MEFSRQSAATLLISLGWNPTSALADCFAKLGSPACIRLHHTEENGRWIEIVPENKGAKIDNNRFDLTEAGVHQAVAYLESFSFIA